MNGKAANVGIVIVSHSPLVARGIADMVRQMVGDCVPLAWSGGNAEGGLGTNAAGILTAIEAAWSDAGVAVFVDLGGAETNSEMAIEMLGKPRSALVSICNAPLVEGAVVAAAEASGGASLAKVVATAEELSP
ncbi:MULTISPECIES: dihydroxyacetone kinase phosphoryl donor subunit DhaM [unclassified Sinorhizobium]|uniref:dihydroxyacetone kinase phosphoryl donor subunit DhaM n=1 Tax=unclassified Sinorhizobium TaxID=2613772 RepID=UPI00352679A0